MDMATLGVCMSAIKKAQSGEGFAAYGISDVTVNGVSIVSDGVAAITVTDGADGTDGKTAYEYAQEGGYTGTENEFKADMAAVGGLADVLAAY